MIKFTFLITLFTSLLFSNIVEDNINENNLKKILFFNYTLSNFYVEDIDQEKILDETFSNYLQSIDPHSTFFSKKQYKEFKENINGDFVGIGVITSMKNKQLEVVTPIYNSPAFKAGIKSKDIITNVNGIDIRKKDTLFIEKIIRGKENTSLKLTVNRNNENIDFELKREKLTIHPIKDELITINNKKILFITIHLFNKLSYIDFKKTIEKYDNYEGIVIDLRNNPGGLLTDSLNIADLFIEKNKILLFEQTKSEVKKHFSQNDVIIPNNIPLGIIINEGSASGSEILAGVLQDYNRAIVIGQQSFGKGSVQQIIPITIGKDTLGAIKLTTSRYYLPSKRSIQNNGVTPNIIVSNEIIKKEIIEDKSKNIKKENDYENSLKNIELKLSLNEEKYLKTPEDTTKFFKKYDDDNQLKSSLSLVYSLIK